MSLRVLILTGQSGSGKSTAIRSLEDRGFLCVDNVPVNLVERLIASVRESQHDALLALCIDVREPGLLKDAPALIRQLRSGPDPVRLVYFEAREEALIRRYSETRRRHPLDRGAGLRGSIAQERDILVPLREMADETIDTSGLSPHDLRATVIKRLVGATVGDDLSLAFVSFGYKYGVPLEADMVLDVRFLPNPYFVTDLKALTGLDEAVQRYVLQHREAAEYVDRAHQFLAFLLPQFQREGKRYLTVAIGCTGGRHRSVTIAGALAERFRSQGIATDLRHRDVAEVQA
jgi:RNase adapter protein RapZ